MKPVSTEPDSTSYQTIVNAIPDMIIRIGKDRVLRSFDGNIKDLHLPIDTCLGKTVEEMLPGAAAESFTDALEKAFATGQVQRLEYSLTLGNRIQYYESRMVKYNDQELIAVVRNVTRQKETEQELRRCQSRLEYQMEMHSEDLSVAESKYKDIFNHSGAPSIIVDQDLTMSMANEKFEEFIGYPRDRIEGRMKWTDLVHPMDRDMVRSYHYARRSKESYAPNEYECRVVDRKNAVKSIIIKVGLLSDPGRAVASMLDITSLKQTEKELRDRESLYSAVLEGYEGFIYFIDDNYTIRFLNENLTQSLDEDASGKICYEALHHRTSKCHWCVAQQVFAGGSIRFEMKNPRDKKWYYSVNVPVKLSDNQIYCQCMITDIDEFKRMEETLRSSEAHLLEENSRLRSSVEERHRFGDIIGQSAQMQEAYEMLLLAASSDNNVIIYGESGTGKELAAKTIHNMSARSRAGFVPINCGAIPENLLESEFFGYQKGAFTGANTDKRGLLDAADKGSLFLDEIGEIKPGFQVKLLRAIEGGGYTPIGSSEIHRPDFRIIAATNRNLFEKVKGGQMRSDFFYRIHVIPIHLPPLRERKEDIPLLAEHFLKAYDRKIRPRITSGVMDTLVNYTWPGNVRELQNVLYRFVTLKRLDLTGQGPSLAPGTETAETVMAPPGAPLAEAVAGFEKQQIIAALAECRWNRTRTAKKLGVGLRTLQRKIKQYAIQ